MGAVCPRLHVVCVGLSQSGPELSNCNRPNPTYLIYESTLGPCLGTTGIRGLKTGAIGCLSFVL